MEHYNSSLEITVSYLGIHKWEPDIYSGFSPALHLQCRIWESIIYLVDIVVHELGWTIDVICTICQAWGGGGGGGGGQHGAAAPGQEGKEQTRQRLAQNYHLQSSAQGECKESRRKNITRNTARKKQRAERRTSFRNEVKTKCELNALSVGI